MTLSSPQDFGDEPGELCERDMLCEAVVVDPVRACVGEVDDVGVF